jgi:hypothetical protein
LTAGLFIRTIGPIESGDAPRGRCKPHGGSHEACADV